MFVDLNSLWEAIQYREKLTEGGLYQRDDAGKGK